MANDLVERLRDTYGNLTPGAIECADLDGMAFTVRDAIKALEAADAMFDILNGQEGRRIASGRPRAGDDQKIAHAIDAYYAATQKGNGDG